MAVTGAYGSGNVNMGITAGNVFRPNVEPCPSSSD
jgi:hypothetical protein